MTPEQRATIFQRLSTAEEKIFKTKGKAYAGTDDTNANFKRHAVNLGLTKYQVWAVYFGKHIDSILNAIKQNPENPVDVGGEGMISRIEDVRVYATLLACLLEEDSEPGSLVY